MGRPKELDFKDYVSFSKVQAAPMTANEYDVYSTGIIYVNDGDEPVEDIDGFLVITNLDKDRDYVTWMSADVFKLIYMVLPSTSLM